ncbi:MAG: hypothetical protein K0S24_1322 [Sphingobacterium sp.]|jgi:hypothetical protein|nr:hypothetical protein [Sphingobacterium sp.]
MFFSIFMGANPIFRKKITFFLKLNTHSAMRDSITPHILNQKKSTRTAAPYRSTKSTARHNKDSVTNKLNKITKLKN